MTEMVTVTLGLTLKPEAVDAFCANLPATIGETAAFPGFGSIRIVRDGAKLLFIETWESEAAYDAYIAWRTETGMMDAMGQILAGPPEKAVWPALVAAA